MNKSQRIYLSTGTTGNQYQDKHVKVKLEQNVETLEFLSMSLSTEDIYQNFNADYGVLVGRVLANGGIGIPNAKVSIFIALTDEDALDSSIASIYPYKTPRDKNTEGKRYNLLPRVAKIDSTGVVKPKQPFGSFPIKEEIVTNIPFLDVYKKYYKYTALTNSAGDYMMFGVPTGTQTIHLSVDITDIGEYSMTPAAMVTNLGYSPNLFTDNNTKIKSSTDLNDLPNIETQEITVDIVPFWGDVENFEIGITRQDFRIRSVLKNTFVIFGSVFTDGDGAMWGGEFGSSERISELYRASSPAEDLVGIHNKRIGEVTEKIYYYPNTISDADISTANPKTDMLVLDSSEYSVYKRDGDFTFIINCNRNKVITNESGEKVSVDEDSIEGIFTEFVGFITLELTTDDVPLGWTKDLSGDMKLAPHRYKLKFPQYAGADSSFQKPNSSGVDYLTTETWRKQYKVFEGSKLYSIAKFYATNYNDDKYDNTQFPVNPTTGYMAGDRLNQVKNNDTYWNVGVLITEDTPDNDNEVIGFPSNSTGDIGSNTYNTFGANWMNLTVHLPQIGHLYDGYHQTLYVRNSTHFSEQDENDDFGRNNYYYQDNAQEIAAYDFNTVYFARSDLHWTDIIEIPINDALAMAEVPLKGFDDTDIPTAIGTEYRNGVYISPDWTATTPCPYGGGRQDGDLLSPADEKFYFFKGYDSADCIAFIQSLGLV